MNDLIQLMKKRRSVRKYLNAPVRWDDILQVLDAAHYAPSSGNQQSWQFIVVENKNKIKDNFKLDDVLLFGTLPPIIGKPINDKIDILSSYINTYLREEIQLEGIVRNLGGFSRFLDMACSQFGELTSYSEIARECQLPVRTVQSYYEILEDTLVGFKLEPWRKSIRKRLSAHPKFYFFDTGVVNATNKRLTAPLESQLKGRLFEQFIILETYRIIHYEKSEANIFFWRTNHGAEIDLLIEKHGKIIAAIEIKATANISGAHLSGIRAFKEERRDTLSYVVCLTKNKYKLNNVIILPWQSYLLEEVKKLIG